VRKQVGEGVARIDAALEQMHPEAHRRLGALELSIAEKEAGLRIVRKFGDPRLVALSHAAAEAMRESAAGDGDHVMRRLSERLAPSLRDLVQLHREMFPQRPIAFQADPHSALAKWHPHVEVDAGAPEAVGRRLSVFDIVNSGVNAHVQTLCETLQDDLGDMMPKAPARMLGSTAGGAGDQDMFKLMNCLTEAVPNPAKVCACLSRNTEHVFKMMMKYAKGLL